jgi:hypothetical protein
LFQAIRPGPRLCVVFRNTDFYGGRLLAPAQPPSWRTTHCLLSATTYSIHSQLPSISAGHLLYPQPGDALYCGENGPILQVVVVTNW